MDELLDEHARELPKGLDRGRLRKELADEVLGLGPLEDLLSDPIVSEVMVVDRATIYVERKGRLELTGQRFSSEDALRSAIERIVTPLGRRIDESTPMVDARLKDGSRVNAIIPPLALRGPCLTIRKFSSRKLGVDDLIDFGSLDARMARFLQRAVIARRNILVSGGTGSGKTTLLNILSSAIPNDERIVTIEDAAELRLDQPHVVSLETRPANMEGKGEYSIRDLVKNALRMRPDRIVVGECRGGEALDMLQAMNTGHDGSLTTTHANSPDEAIARLETLVLMGGVELPTRAIREQIANSIHLVVQQQRFVDGTRKITSIAEVIGMDDEGTVRPRADLRVPPHARRARQGDGRVPRHRLHAVVHHRVHHDGARHRRRVPMRRGGNSVLDDHALCRHRRRDDGGARRRAQRLDAVLDAVAREMARLREVGERRAALALFAAARQGLRHPPRRRHPRGPAHRRRRHRLVGLRPHPRRVLRLRAGVVDGAARSPSVARRSTSSSTPRCSRWPTPSSSRRTSRTRSPPSRSTSIRRSRRRRTSW